MEFRKAAKRSKHAGRWMAPIPGRQRRLSFAEASMAMAALARAQLDLLDSGGDNALCPAELDAYIEANIPDGCFHVKQTHQKLLDDTLILLLALGALAGRMRL